MFLHYVFQLNVSRAEELKQSGEDLIEDDHYAVDCIRPKCLELQRMCEQYRVLVRKRYELLNKAKDLHQKIDAVSNKIQQQQQQQQQQQHNTNTFKGIHTSYIHVLTVFSQSEHILITWKESYW